MITYLNAHIDKLVHFLGGFFFCTVVALLSPEWGLYASIVIGVSKEIYDKVSDKGTAEMWDALCTIAGGVLAYLIVIRL